MTSLADIPVPRTPVQKVSTATPSVEDQSLIGKLRVLFQQARDTRKPVVAQWNKNYKLIRNRTGISELSPSWRYLPELPEISPIVDSMVGWMMDQRPSFEVAPQALSGTEYYEHWSTIGSDLQTTLLAAGQNDKWSTEISKGINDALVYGTGFFKSTWDATLDQGYGNAALRRVDPYTIYPDPQATSTRDWEYVFEVYTLSVDEIDRRWPGSAKIFPTGGMVDSSIDESPKRTDSPSAQRPYANPGALSPATSARYGLPGQSGLNAYTTPGITVFECWVKEHEIKQDENGMVNVIPSWRVIVVAGDHVLMNEKASDIWDHGEHPYSRFVLKEEGEFWGTSMVELLAPAQLAINRLLAAFQLNIELVSNPILVEDAFSGTTRQRITNRPGSRVQKNTPNSTLQWLEPPTLSPQQRELIEFYIREMERISGLSAITRGSMPTGRNSSGVMDQIQEASFVRIRLALQNLENALYEAGVKLADNIVDFYDAPRFIAVLGPDGEGTATQLKARHFYTQGPNGEVPFRYTLRVDAGSDKAVAPSARRAEANQLFALGAIDHQALLEVYNWPHRQEVLKRINAQMLSGLYNPPGKRERARA